ncbi:LysR substrate-binding domain-containing protein [Actinocorallia sp. API 0066]|uniref:LysR family transcriptional regulator n=1 Tax=Actinocorallia sp. API 0066 TaxID=2896846 RepID=UPI001E29FFA6|nr:LysR family transcriptional regulator [Actinocorallia sp. API 0066]MCD0447849.1 LysR substrate-binding domain-containing protein [Actinocorallia sp. API 0066]
MLDVRRLRLLRELAHRGTIAAVAEALAFTPSAVSQQLSALEREAGVPLLERTGRRVALTPAGLSLVRHADAVLDRLDQAAAELARARQGLAGPLRVGTFASAGHTIVPTALRLLAARHPGLEPRVLELDPADVAAALRAGELDVALIHEYDFAADPAHRGLATTPLCTEAMYLASPSPGATTRVETPDASAIAAARDLPWITAKRGTLCRQMTLRACEAAGFTPHTRHEIDDFPTTLAFAASNLGVALVPELALSNPPPGLLLTRTPLHRRTRIAYRTGTATHPAVTTITTALKSAHRALTSPG